jgi:predicted nucleic acid-binding protein
VLRGGSPRAAQWLDGGSRAIYSSTLLQVELARVLRRERLSLSRARPVIDRIALISIDDGILTAAAAIEPAVKSLDAIHLATCALLGSAACLVTHDRAMARAASVLGIPTIDPLESP